MDRLHDVEFSDYAARQMRRRGLAAADVVRVVRRPESVERVREARVVLQARLPLGPSGKVYLVRVFVDVDRQPPRVVTTYQTRRFSRYGSSPP